MMKPNISFLQQPKTFWAHVRTISQGVGYTERMQGQIKIPTVQEIVQLYKKIDLNSTALSNGKFVPTELGNKILSYFEYRANELNSHVAKLLMDAPEAEKKFEALRKQLKTSVQIPMNKQKGDKRKPAFLTGMVNMLIHSNAEGIACDYDPRSLTTVTINGNPIRTLARRVDGAFPSITNPIAIWEIKEYYYTTTFGSRVADGVYETLLDGLELEELKQSEKISVKHYLFVDSRYTWWECGRSYLCRIIDMLHMGYVDEVFFGKEILSSLPTTVKEWVKIYRNRS